MITSFISLWIVLFVCAGLLYSVVGEAVSIVIGTALLALAGAVLWELWVRLEQVKKTWKEERERLHRIEGMLSQLLRDTEAETQGNKNGNCSDRIES